MRKEYVGLPVSIFKVCACGGVPTNTLAKYAVSKELRSRGMLRKPEFKDSSARATASTAAKHSFVNIIAVFVTMMVKQ